MMRREIHLSPKMLIESMQIRKGDFAPYVIISGQPQRAQMILSRLENPIRNFSTFGYTFWTGYLGNDRVTVGNGGMYSPDTALNTEIICNLKVKTLLRIGSCGAMREDMDIGDFVVVDGVIRGDGVTNYYVSKEFFPKSDKTLSDKLFSLASSYRRTHRGTIWTTDAILKETRDLVNKKIEEGAIAVDMVTSPFLTISNLYGKSAVALLVVTDNLITGELGFFDIRVFDAERDMSDIALKFLKEVYG